MFPLLARSIPLDQIRVQSPTFHTTTLFLTLLEDGETVPPWQVRHRRVVGKMWSVTIIVVVAVAGGVGLVVLAVLLAVSIERRRHWRLMQQYGLRKMSIHRPTLSANENNYAHIPQPNSHVRSRGRPARLPATWTTVPSEESIPLGSTPEEQSNNDDSMLPGAKRRKSLRSSLHGYSFNVPRTRRQKKIQKATPLDQMPQSPLSAITELTDSQAPMATELPIEITPREAPNRPPRSPESLHIAKTRAARTLSQEVATNRPDKRAFARSVSMTSTFTAPAEPLPPLPIFDTYKSQRHNEPWRNSTTSLDTVGSSVLGTVFSSPSRVGTDLTVPSTNLDGMQTFDFGFNESKATARLFVPPVRQTMQGFCNGKTGISSIRPSVEYHNGRAISLESTSHNRLKAYQDTFRTIDASSWNFQSQPRSANSQARHSIQDYGCVLGKRNHLDTSFGASPQMVPRRPASVASGNPYQWDLEPAFSAMRISAGSNEVRKGHKRQNCVRIANLPVQEQRNSRVEQMPELLEEQPETPNDTQVKIPGLTLLEAGQPVLRARASLVDVKGSPSPLHNRPVLVPSRPRHSPFYRASNSSAGSARPDSDVFSTGQPDPKTPESFRHSTRQWPLSPISPNNIKLNVATPSYDSPTLPSPINAANLFPRISRIMGPRNPPPSGLSPRTGSPSPVGSRPVQKRVAPDDLRKSIMALRSMNSEGRLLDAPSSRNYRAIGDEREDSSMNLSLSPTMNSLGGNNHPYPRERRYGSAAFGARSKMSIAMSPSGMSLGGTSIWEDASVRGDSPEPELLTVPSPILVLEDVDAPLPQTPKLVVPYPDPEAYENMGPKMYAKEQAANRFASPQGKGLGLRIGNAILGTPGSLYDRDGFLKE